MLSAISWIAMLLGTAYTAFWLFLFYKGKKFDQMFSVLDDDDFKYNFLYGVGGVLMEMSHYEYRSKADRKLRQQLSILYAEKYVEYYVRVVYAQRATMASLVLLFAAPVYAFTENFLYFILIIGFAGFTFYYYGTLQKEKIEERNTQIINEFCEVVSKLALLTNAGAILREAWKQVAYGGEGLIYDEMQLTVEDMENGVSDADAIYKFGVRCVVLEAKKFATTIIQGLSKGNAELSLMMQQQSSELWHTKQQLVKRQAEEAASKLLLPMAVMFVGVLIMIIVPLFTNMGL